MEWQYLEGASIGLNDIFAPHRSRGHGRKSAKEQPTPAHVPPHDTNPSARSDSGVSDSTAFIAAQTFYLL